MFPVGQEAFQLAFGCCESCKVCFGGEAEAAALRDADRRGIEKFTHAPGLRLVFDVGAVYGETVPRRKPFPV